MRPRGPDNQSVVVEDGFALGHVRLSIIDVREEANQPMRDKSGRYVIVYNGEIYNFQELRETLRKKNIQLRTNSDTEVLLEMCVHIGLDETLFKVRGMFAFVFFDTATSKGFAVRDHFGQKPLFYSSVGKELTIASAVEPIRSFHDFADPNLDAYQVFLSTKGIVLPGQTFFKDISALPAGHVMEFGGSGINIRRYFEPSSLIYSKTLSKHRKWRKDQILLNLESHFKTAVKRHLVSDVPVGILLSGGMDSTLLYWYASDIRNGLTCMTKISPGIEKIPLSVVPKVMEMRPSTSVFSVNKPEHYLADLDDFIKWYGSPPPWGGGPPMNRLCQEARDRGVKVMLSGDCCDEYSAGYESYHRAFDRFDGDMFELGEQMGIDSSFPVFRRQAVDAFFDHQKDVRRELLDVFGFIKTSKERFMQASLLHDTLQFLQSCVLPHSDAYSMKASIELRNPFLDIDLVRYVVNLPLHWRYYNKGSKYRLKRLFRDLAVNKIGAFMDVEKEGTRNFSMAISDKKYWEFNNFSLNKIFQLPGKLTKKQIFRIISLELFHRRFILSQIDFLPSLLSGTGRGVLL